MFNTINTLTQQWTKTVFICLEKQRLVACVTVRKQPNVSTMGKPQLPFKGHRQISHTHNKTLENIWQKAASPSINNTQWKMKKLMAAIHGSALRMALARYYNVVYRDIHYRVKSRLVVSCVLAVMGLLKWPSITVKHCQSTRVVIRWSVTQKPCFTFAFPKGIRSKAIGLLFVLQL